jgi:citrate lyase beta subunit
MSEHTSTLRDDCKSAVAELSKANEAFAKTYPGDRPDRQPIHTVYGGAHLFKATTPGKLGELALRSLDTYAPDAGTFAGAVGIEDTELGHKVYERVRSKLEREAVEDFRIDFEDGYGNRPDAEEDETAITAAKEVAKGMKEDSLSPFIGIRIKPLNAELEKRSIRTLDLFMTTLAKETGGALPDNFVVTLPKVQVVAQVEALVKLFESLEKRLGIAEGALKMETMVELTQSIIDADGNCPLPGYTHAAKGRLSAAHFGTYDYTASCNITAAYQSVTHPACDFALHVMKNAFAGSGVWLSDGATTVMPVPVHRVPKGEVLTGSQQHENQQAIFSAWKLAYDNVRHALENGIYQGWDLHPAQLPIRYAATFAFFLEGFDAAAHRLRNFVDKAAQATLVGDVFDDAATGQGLINYFLRGLSSGCVSLDELEQTGLSQEEVETRSFVKILAGRAKG